MKKLIYPIIFCLTLFPNINLKAQQLHFFGNAVFFKGKEISKTDLEKKLSNNQDALVFYNKSNSLKFTGNLMQSIGVIVIGGGLIAVLTDDSPNQKAGIICLGAFVTKVGFYVKCFGNRKMKKAIKIYNNKLLKSESNRVQPSLNLGLTQTGLGLSINF